MPVDTALERFKKFKATLVSSNVSNSVLLEMIENFITTDGDNTVVEAIPVLDGQLSLFDVSTYKELINA